MKTATKRTTLKLLGALTPIVLAMLSGCASEPTTGFQPFTPEDLNAKVKSGQYTQKVDNFLVIMDASSSMDDTYVGPGFPENPSADKFSVEKEFLSRMNQTIPHLKLNSGLRAFGFGSCLDWEFTKLKAPLASYSQSAFQSAVNTQECASGGSPIGDAIAATSGDLQGAQGKLAVIVVGDGNQVSGKSPTDAVKELKQQYGDRLCVYSVSLSEPGTPGDDLMVSLYGASICGAGFRVGDVVSKAGAANFVTRVFLQHGDDCSTRDSDGDGVNDCNDQCPNTPKGVKVNSVGCWVLANVLFDTDKATIKPVSFPELDGVVKVFKGNPGLRVEVDGHTDSDGSDEHNLGLSQRRAEAVREYLVGHGIAADRLTAKGFGESKPVATNATAEGKALNRRVELNVLK